MYGGRAYGDQRLRDDHPGFPADSRRSTAAARYPPAAGRFPKAAGRFPRGAGQPPRAAPYRCRVYGQRKMSGDHHSTASGPTALASQTLRSAVAMPGCHFPGCHFRGCRQTGGLRQTGARSLMADCRSTIARAYPSWGEVPARAVPVPRPRLRRDDRPSSRSGSSLATSHDCHHRSQPGLAAAQNQRSENYPQIHRASHRSPHPEIHLNRHSGIHRQAFVANHPQMRAHPAGSHRHAMRRPGHRRSAAGLRLAGYHPSPWHCQKKHADHQKHDRRTHADHYRTCAALGPRPIPAGAPCLIRQHPTRPRLTRPALIRLALIQLALRSPSTHQRKRCPDTRRGPLNR